MEKMPKLVQDKIKCFNSKCDGNHQDLRYVSRSIEYFYLHRIHTEEKWAEFEDLDTAYNDDDFDPYITCNKCGRDFNLDGSERLAVEHIHTPDWSTTQYVPEGNPLEDGPVFDIWCKCGHSGSFRFWAKDIQWE